MNIDINLTESDVAEFLENKAKDFGYKAPRVLIVQRIAIPNGLAREVTFALVVPINNDALLDALISDSFTNKDFKYNFKTSELNLQGEIELDYLFFEAIILAKIKK